MKCIQLVNENPVILASRNDYCWVSFVFSKLFALKDKILSLNVGLKSVPKTILGIDISSGTFDEIEVFGVFSTIVTLGLLIPYVAVSVRRLHDTNRSGWWIMVNIITVCIFY